MSLGRLAFAAPMPGFRSLRPENSWYRAMHVPTWGGIGGVEDFEKHDIKDTEKHAMRTRIQWSRYLPSSLRKRLCNEEWIDFCNKRGVVCSRKVSRMIGNVDLITPLMEYR
ncbi:hypothetical protein GOP47_0028284 [Adiantum capillus-veneris]|nr:hypothetical protein GOP47_0028284 [Adiantum capillus-veneris]